MARFQEVRNGQTAPGIAAGGGAGASRTTMSRVIVPQPGAASAACHVPAAGEATSANQKYGGPPWRSRDLAATLPSGAISESSPSSGFSAAKMTRNGAPFHGAIGADRTAISAAPSSQVPDGFGRASPLLRKAGRKTRLRSAAMPQQQAGVLETSESPSWNALKLHPIPAARGGRAGYRIGGDQSAGMKAILRPAGPFAKQKRLNSSGPVHDF